MIYTTHYRSPIGDILIASKNDKLIGLWIENQKYYLAGLKEEITENDNIEILNKTKNWLDRYFLNERPEINELELEPAGSDFRKSVWKILCKIPTEKLSHIMISQKK